MAASASVLHAPITYSTGVISAPWTIAAPLTSLAVEPKWIGPQHLPIIGPNGVPLDTPEVAAGKVSNAIAHAEVSARNGDLAIAAPIAAPWVASIAAPITASIAAPLAATVAVAAEPKWTGPLHLPVIGPSGVPLDTPEVAAGKAANARAHAEITARNGDIEIVQSPLENSVVVEATPKWTGPQHIPVIGPNGVPLDTPEVAAGKAANARAHAEVEARNIDVAVATPIAARIATPIITPIPAPLTAAVAVAVEPKWIGPQHLPVIGTNGVPLDTPEVAAGKAANAAAHAEAYARNGGITIASIAPVAAPIISTRILSTPLTFARYASHALPIIAANGVPLDTPEVAIARAAHLQAHLGARLRNVALPWAHLRKRRGIALYPEHIPVIGQNGVPLETPEVIAAKANHAAIFAETAARDINLAPWDTHLVSAPWNSVVPAPVAAPITSRWIGPVHIPVIGPNGVPIDTPEVAAGKLADAQAHAKARGLIH